MWYINMQVTFVCICFMNGSSLNQCWFIENWTPGNEFIFWNALYGERPQPALNINTVRLRPNGCYFADAIFRCISLNENFRISNKSLLKYVPEICSLNQCWFIENWTPGNESIFWNALYGERPQPALNINTVRLRPNGCYFADAIFRCISLNENFRISNKSLLKYVPQGLIDNMAALVQIMAWHRLGDKSLSEPIMVSLLTHICITQLQWVKPFKYQLIHIAGLNTITTVPADVLATNCGKQSALMELTP